MRLHWKYRLFRKIYYQNVKEAGLAKRPFSPFRLPIFYEKTTVSSYSKSPFCVPNYVIIYIFYNLKNKVSAAGKIRVVSIFRSIVTRILAARIFLFRINAGVIFFFADIIVWTIFFIICYIISWNFRIIQTIETVKNIFIIQNNLDWRKKHVCFFRMLI